MPRTQLTAEQDVIALEERLAELTKRGVIVVDPRQTFIGSDVELDRVCAGATLHPGTRLRGRRTFVGPGAEVGAEGPATIVDAILGHGAVVDAGYVEGAVLLDGAKVGWGGHIRPGTILEEQASTAHVVGLKHTVLLSFVTLGSLINFCDALVAGGTSRRDHSEIGSGFIHFNFTPWGARGDKATPSLVGDVVDGVFLRKPRIFLGGSSGLVGPAKVGYGAITGAGQVVRRDVREGMLSVQASRAVEVERKPGHLDRAGPRRKRNINYVAQLVALRCWYRQVRLARVPDSQPERAAVYEGALHNLDLLIEERVRRLTSFLAERGHEAPSLRLDVDPPCPLPVEATDPYVDHVTWVQGLDDGQVRDGRAWLHSIVEDVGREAESS